VFNGSNTAVVQIFEALPHGNMKATENIFTSSGHTLSTYIWLPTHARIKCLPFKKKVFLFRGPVNFTYRYGSVFDVMQLESTNMSEL
jgi:hypothetical protein